MEDDLSNLVVTRTVHEEHLLSLRREVLVLLERGVELETIASKACIATVELEKFVLPAIHENVWAPEFPFNIHASRRLLSTIDRMIRETTGKEYKKT